MEIIKFQGIGTDDLDIEGAIEGAETVYIEGNTAIFKVESPEQNTVMEVRVGKVPFWNFSIGPYDGQFTRNPQWRNARYMQQQPLLTEILEIEVPEDAIVERIG